MKATITARKGVNLRVQPVTGARVVRVLELGEEINVTLVHDGWCTCEEGYFMARFADVTEGDTATLEQKQEQPQKEPETTDDAPTGQEAENQPADGATDGDTATLEQMTVDELKKLAKESGIEVKASAKKAEIIAAIVNAD